MTQLRDAALAYAERGVAVFPLKPWGKTPVIRKAEGGRGHRDATCNPDIVRAWWRRWPNANIGAGPASFGAVAFDIDTPESQAIAQSLGLLDGDTYATVTCGGSHRYFLAADLPRRRSISLRVDDVPGYAGPPPAKGAPALVTRYASGYCVLPPSVRETGFVYRPRGRFADMAPLPNAAREAYLHACDRIERQESTLGSPACGPLPSRSSSDDGDSAIARFNRAFSADDLLRRNGYTKHGDRYRRPGSVSVAGVVVLEDGAAFSHHATDAIADGHKHSSFGLFCLLEHNGDVRSAVKAAAEVLGLNARPHAASASRAFPRRIVRPPAFDRRIRR